MQTHFVKSVVVQITTDSNRRMLFTVGAVLALASVQACTGDCVSVGVPGVVVTVTDALTKSAPASMPSLRVTDGSYVEDMPRQLFDKSPPELWAAVERPGVYTVLVRATGYQDFVKEGVRVSRSDAGCAYLKQARISAELIRQP